MKIGWHCECAHYNETLLDWKAARHGQGFYTECENCKNEMDIEIKIEVSKIYQEK